MNKLTTSNILGLLLCAFVLGAYLWSSDITLYLALIIFTILLFTAKGRAFISSLGFRKQENWRKTIVIVVIGLVAVLSMNSVVSTIVSTVPAEEILSQDSLPFDEELLEEVDEPYGPIDSLGFFLFLLVNAVIVGGFVEEMLFRGILLTYLPKALGDSNLMLFAIVLVTSLIFGYQHLFQGLPSAVGAVSFSIVMGFIYLKTDRNLWIVVLIHAVNNAIAITGGFLLTLLFAW